MGTLSQTLTLRAAFASSTYLLPQIPGPACLNPPIPLFKGAHQASVRTRAHATASLFFGRHLIMPCQSLGLCFFACLVLKKFTDVEWCAQCVINYVSAF